MGTASTSIFTRGPTKEPRSSFSTEVVRARGGVLGLPSLTRLYGGEALVVRDEGLATEGAVEGEDRLGRRGGGFSGRLSRSRGASRWRKGRKFVEGRALSLPSSNFPSSSILALQRHLLFPHHILLIQPCLSFASFLFSLPSWATLIDFHPSDSSFLRSPFPSSTTPSSLPSFGAFDNLPSDLSSSIVVVPRSRRRQPLVVRASEDIPRLVVVVLLLVGKPGLDCPTPPLARQAGRFPDDSLHAGNGYQSTCLKDAVEHND